MPGSNWCGLSHSVQFLCDQKPQSVLDVGVGFGKWGFLARFYLDVYKVRWRKSEWTTRIVGVETWPEYIDVHHRHLYDEIIEGDILDIEPTLGEFDLTIACDVLEHIEKSKAVELVKRLKSKSKALLIGMPCGPGWMRPSMWENPFEAHISEWLPEDFPWANYVPYVAPCGLGYGVFTWIRE